jgi:hypothetical protein
MIERVRLAKSPPKSHASAPASARRLAPFGPPPLIEGEDRAAYDEFLARVSAAVKPVDILEEIWVRDIVDLEWEVLRLRRLKAALMTASAYTALWTVLNRLLDEETGDTDEETDDTDEETGDIDTSQLAREWVRRNPDAIKEVDRILASADLTMDAVGAEMLSDNIDNVERIERMIAMAEARRNAVLREIDCHRATLGQELRRTVRQVEAREFKVIEAKSAKGKGPA